LVPGVKGEEGERGGPVTLRECIQAAVGDERGEQRRTPPSSVPDPGGEEVVAIKDQEKKTNTGGGSNKKEKERKKKKRYTPILETGRQKKNGQGKVCWEELTKSNPREVNRRESSRSGALPRRAGGGNTRKAQVSEKEKKVLGGRSTQRKGK